MARIAGGLVGLLAGVLWRRGGVLTARFPGAALVHALRRVCRRLARRCVRPLLAFGRGFLAARLTGSLGLGLLLGRALLASGSPFAAGLIAIGRRLWFWLLRSSSAACIFRALLLVLRGGLAG